MTFLLDVNALIALVDPKHAAHDYVHAWFTQSGGADWATCPITQNGAVRIVSQPGYPNSTGSPGLAAAAISGLVRHPGHEFWHDDISLLDVRLFTLDRMAGPAQVTDTYLLALANKHGGKLATLDRRLVVDAVPDGRASLHLIESSLQ